jgi:hypothetical protein
LFVDDFLLDEEAQKASKILNIDRVFIAIEVFYQNIRIIAKNGENDKKLWFA